MDIDVRTQQGVTRGRMVEGVGGGSSISGAANVGGVEIGEDGQEH